MIAETSRCYRHPNREALIRCTRCDRPICPECMRDAPVGFHCPDDAALGARSIRPQRTAVGARLRESPPYATTALILLNIAAYVYTGLKSPGGLDQPYAAKLFLDWQLQPDIVYHQDQYYRFVTSAFLHISLLHIGANMFALGIVGPQLERLLGRSRFVAVYLLGALGGSAAIFAFGSPDQPVVGASGAIFGLFGACLVMVRRLGLDVQWLIGIIVLNFVITFSVRDISKLGHVGGVVAGALAAIAIAGLPSVRRPIPARLQAAGLSGVLVLTLVIVAVRAANGF
ncbi:MAG: rhomboid family intramembrane serine protease [Jatrophihabitantaceae bacterium]